MKQSSFLFFILLTVSILSSCNKEEPISPTIVNGQVLEQGSNKPLEGVKVVIVEVTSSGGLFGSQSYYPIDTILTDKDGRYTYQNFVDKPSVHYILRFYKDQYFNLDTASDEVFVTWNKATTPITKMYSFGWITVRVTNTIPFDVNDKVEVGGEWTNGQYNRYQGKDINSIFTQKIRGGNKTQVVWWVIKNDIIKSYADSVYIKPHDTTYFQIKY